MNTTLHFLFSNDFVISYFLNGKEEKIEELEEYENIKNEIMILFSVEYMRELLKQIDEDNLIHISEEKLSEYQHIKNIIKQYYSKTRKYDFCHIIFGEIFLTISQKSFKLDIKIFMTSKPKRTIELLLNCQE